MNLSFEKLNRSLAFLFVLFAVFNTHAAEILRLGSKHISETVTARVALPESYYHSDSFQYPVLLVMDGSTQFEHIAGNVNFLSTFSIVPEMMAVGAVHQLSGDSAYEDKVDWGQSILEKGVEVFGQSEILWDSLATVYSMNDNNEDALRASNNALRLAREHQSKYISEIEAQNSDLKKQTER